MGRNLERQNETWGDGNGARWLVSVWEVKARGATKRWVEPQRVTERLI